MNGKSEEEKTEESEGKTLRLLFRSFVLVMVAAGEIDILICIFSKQ